jgi:hypothetical protein
VQSFARRHDALRQCQLADRVAWRDALVPPFGRIRHIGAVGEPGELGGELLTLVMSGLNAKGEAALAAAYHRALDATEVIEISNDAFAELDADRRQQRRAACGCIDQPAGVLLLVGTHEAAEQGDREPLVAPTIRRNARKDAQRAAGEGRRAA